jgi:putative transposase
MVTGGTLYKEHVFKGAERLTLLEAHLLRIASEHHWQVEAWAVFPNHYHFIARGQPECCDLGKFVRHLHADTARVVNRSMGNWVETCGLTFGIAG